MYYFLYNLGICDVDLVHVVVIFDGIKLKKYGKYPFFFFKEIFDIFHICMSRILELVFFLNSFPVVILTTKLNFNITIKQKFGI